MFHKLGHLLKSKPQPTTLYEAPLAAEIAARLQSGESEGWRYLVQKRSNRWYAVAILDEEGILVGYWNSK